MSAKNFTEEFKINTVKQVSPHRFRHTLATELMKAPAETFRW